MRIADMDIQKVYEDLYNKAGLWYIYLLSIIYSFINIFKEFVNMNK